MAQYYITLTKCGQWYFGGFKQFRESNQSGTLPGEAGRGVPAGPVRLFFKGIGTDKGLHEVGGLLYHCGNDEVGFPALA